MEQARWEQEQGQRRPSAGLEWAREKMVNKAGRTQPQLVERTALSDEA